MASTFWEAIREDEERRMVRRFVYDPWYEVAPGIRRHVLTLFAGSPPELPAVPGGFLTPWTYPG